MNVGELKVLLELRNVPDEHELVVRFKGGIGSSTIVVESGYPGFDWTAKQLVLIPKTDLVIDGWYRTLKKGADVDASHVGRLIEQAEKVIEESNAPGVDCSRKALDGAIADLELSLTRFARFQKQGF